MQIFIANKIQTLKLLYTVLLLTEQNSYTRKESQYTTSGSSNPTLILILIFAKPSMLEKTFYYGHTKCHKR